MDKTPVIRLNYTKHPQGLSRRTIEECKALDQWSCPCCTQRTEFDRNEYDIVGGKYLAYVVHYWEDRSGEIIHAVAHTIARMFTMSLSFVASASLIEQFVNKEIIQRKRSRIES